MKQKLASLIVLIIFSLTINAQTDLTYLLPADFDGFSIDFDLTQGDCNNLGGDFCFGTAPLWVEDPTDPDGSMGAAIPSFPFPDIAFSGGCEPFTYIVDPPYASDPLTITLPDGGQIELSCPPVPVATVVNWTVVDACNDTLTWRFDLEIGCVDCPPSVTCDPSQNFLEACSHCEKAVDINNSSCYTCDVGLLNGYCSCTPTGSSTIDNSIILCVMICLFPTTCRGLASQQLVQKWMSLSAM